MLKSFECAGVVVVLQVHLAALAIEIEHVVQQRCGVHICACVCALVEW